VYGDGELAQDFCEGIAARGLQGHLIARGSTDDLYACYPRAAVVTLTSRREGLPLTLLEGKACGIPLIAFDVLTGPREIIRDGIDGLLIEPGDTARFAEELARLMSNDALRERMSAAARDDVKRFSQEAIYAKWQALLAEMTGDTAENYASSAAVNPSPGIETTSNTEKHPLASTPPANKSHSPHRQAQR
jgi:glycosyltransferase involved in cell wall biosynthesis